MMPDQLKAGAKDAGAVAKKIEGIGEGMNGHPLPQDQTIMFATASAISLGVGRIVRVMAEPAASAPVARRSTYAHLRPGKVDCKD